MKLVDVEIKLNSKNQKKRKKGINQAKEIVFQMKIKLQKTQKII